MDRTPIVRGIKRLFLAALRKAVTNKLALDSVPFRHAKGLLFVRFSPHLGSSMVTTPIFSLFKKVRPDLKIGIACDRFNYEIHRYNPHIDEFFVLPNPLHGLLRACLSFHRLRARVGAYDWLVADLANSRHVNLVPALFTGIGKRAGFGGDGSVLDYALPFPPRGTSELQWNLRLLKAFGVEVIPPDLEPEIYFSDEEVSFVDRFLAGHGVDRNRQIVAIQTQSKDGKPNRWYEDRFTQLADKIVGELGAIVIFTGAAGELKGIERIRQKMTHQSIVAAGHTTISQLAALLRRCRIFVTLDTGSMHVGRAVNVPMVVIASAFQAPENWLPVNNPMHVILRHGEVPCALCYKDFCATTECMEKISVSEVFQAVCDQLKICEAPATTEISRSAK